MFHHKENVIKSLLLVLVCMKYDFELVGGETRCIDRERQALLRFKQQLIDEYGTLSSWGSEECCNWAGIKCSNSTGHVTGLLLQAGLSDSTSFYQQFRGKISPALLHLHHLNYLDLSWNDFGGDPIPDFIGSIKMLQYLNLALSNFSGIIPPQLGNLTNLRTLYLYENNLWSDNLHWFSHLSSLTDVDLSGSYISDTNWLQHVVMNLPSLQTLILYNCTLSDVVTPSANLFVNSSSSSSSLSDLHLSNNDLTSSTFDWLFNITSLVSIWLHSNKLDGPIPDAFAKLKFLEGLSLSWNMLEGGIPKSLGNLSRLQSLYLYQNDMESFGNLSCQAMVSLEILQLSDNEITGPVPDLGACSELRRLDLGSNGLTGSLPASLGQLSKLEVLDISDNSLKGTITEANFIELHNLKRLVLSFNSLTLDFSPDWIPPFHLDDAFLASCQMARGSFPTWLRTQSDLLGLDIYLAGISDEVPKWLWNMSKLQHLNMSHNQIWGTIPDLSFSSSMYMLDVGYNNLSGHVPFINPQMLVLQMSFNRFSGSISSICPYGCSLQWMDISNNQLEGALPNDWANLKDLEILNVNYNNLFGQIPDSLGSLSNLQTLHLRGNNFSGELPSTLKNCTLLQQIDIGENRFTGNIPPWLGENHTSLVFLSLPRNMFYGDIPPGICRLTQIQLLDLSHNNLTGKIPKCFDNFTALVDKNMTTTTSIYIRSSSIGYMDYALVQWKGQRAEYNRILGLLKLIDLSSNKLVGSIPESFSNLKGLISLNLSRNGLTGNIIRSIGEMEMLETLDLSSNQLSGKIPIGLTKLSYLAVVDLANNNLSGAIPQSTQLLGFNASAYAGNNGLCGHPLPLCVNTTMNKDKGADINEKDGGGLTRLSSTQEFCITLALGFIVGFWGVVGSLVLKRSWTKACFNFFDAVGDWLYVTANVFLNKFRRS